MTVRAKVAGAREGAGARDEVAGRCGDGVGGVVLVTAAKGSGAKVTGRCGDRVRGAVFAVAAKGWGVGVAGRCLGEAPIEPTVPSRR